MASHSLFLMITGWEGLSISGGLELAGVLEKVSERG
jgi:hypothetical protein